MDSPSINLIELVCKKQQTKREEKVGFGCRLLVESTVVCGCDCGRFAVYELEAVQILKLLGYRPQLLELISIPPIFFGEPVQHL